MVNDLRKLVSCFWNGKNSAKLGAAGLYERMESYMNIDSNSPSTTMSFETMSLYFLAFTKLE